MRSVITPGKITAVDGTAVFTESIAVSRPFVSDVSLWTMESGLDYQMLSDFAATGFFDMAAQFHAVGVSRDG